MGVFVRGTRLWTRHQDETGAWVNKKTPYLVGQEDLAERFHRTIAKEMSSRRAAGLRGPLTLRSFAEKWCDEREAIGLAAAHDDRTRLRLHVLPALGDISLDEVRPKHVKNLVLDLRKAGKLAPRTVRHAYAILSTLFRHAASEELVQGTPCVLPRGVLPAVEDKDPEWRQTAIFTRLELESLISDPRLLLDRRVLYGIKGLAGLRHGEAARLRWRNYDPEQEPLGALAIGLSKTKVQRRVPVHPTLARLLTFWQERGWEATYGRKPRGEDVVVPTRFGNERAAPESQRSFLRDLATLELRERRGHDLRRTFISLAQEDGAAPHVLKLVTHGPPKGIMDLYTTYPWAVLCKEVGKLRVHLRGRWQTTPRRAGRWASTFEETNSG